MNANSQLNETLKKSKAELHKEEGKNIQELLRKSGQDRLARMKNFVKYIDIAYEMSGDTQDFKTFNTFMRKFRDSSDQSAEDTYLCMRDYHDPKRDTGLDYKNYEGSCGDLRAVRTLQIYMDIDISKKLK
jgi:hypothetical protein